jgi:transcriptional regulator with XRE-family HTH domain
MDLKNYIGRKIRSARLSQGLTQEALAERIGKAVETISNIERGRTHAGLATIEHIANTLGIPMRDFFEKSENNENLGQARLDMELMLQSEASSLTDDNLRVTLELVRSLANKQPGSLGKRKT